MLPGDGDIAQCAARIGDDELVPRSIIARSSLLRGMPQLVIASTPSIALLEEGCFAFSRGLGTGTSQAVPKAGSLPYPRALSSDVLLVAMLSISEHEGGTQGAVGELCVAPRVHARGIAARARVHAG